MLAWIHPAALKLFIQNLRNKVCLYFFHSFQVLWNVKLFITINCLARHDSGVFYFEQDLREVAVTHFLNSS